MKGKSDHIQKIDSVLKFLYDNFEKEYSEHDIMRELKWKRSTYNDNIFESIISKLKKDGLIRRERGVCQINFDGMTFHDYGGFSGEMREKQRYSRNTSLNLLLLILTILVSGVGVFVQYYLSKK